MVIIVTEDREYKQYPIPCPLKLLSVVYGISCMEAFGLSNTAIATAKRSMELKSYLSFKILFEELLRIVEVEIGQYE